MLNKALSAFALFYGQPAPRMQVTALIFERESIRIESPAESPIVEKVDPPAAATAKTNAQAAILAAPPHAPIFTM